jgi:capsular polysaccharide biosynthesis protein
MTDRPLESRDEIELVEILRVIWKWKYLILVGTLVCALITAVVNLNRPKIYRTGMVLRLASHVDSPENVRVLIESGRFSKEIRQYGKTISKDRKPINLQLKCVNPKKSDILKISYETASVDIGLQILDFIHKSLIEEYREKVKEKKGKYDIESKLKLNFLSDLKEQKKVIKNKISYAQKRLNELSIERGKIVNNNAKLIENRNSLLNDVKDNNVLLIFLYNNLLNKNLQLKNNYNNEIFNYLSIIQQAEADLKRMEQESKLVSREVEDLELRKSNVQSFEIVKSPSGSRKPIRPKVKFNVVIAGVLGLFVTLLMAFLLEYIRSKGESDRQ